MVLRISLRVCSSMLSYLHMRTFHSDRHPVRWHSTDVLGTRYRPLYRASRYQAHTVGVRVSPVCAVRYNAPQDGKYNVETGNGGTCARRRFRVAWYLRADSLPGQA